MVKKVIFVLPSLGKGGAQRATISLANYLAEKDGYEILVAALKNDDLEFSIQENIKLLKLSCPSFKSSIKKLSKVFRDEKPDIVYSALWHVNLLVIISKYLNILAGCRGFRHIASIHNNPTRIIQTENKYLAVVYYYFFSRLSNKVVAVSRGIERHLLEKCKISSSKILMAYNPAITNDHKSKLEETLSIPFANENKGRYLLWVGRLDYQKDPIKFLEISLLSGMPSIIVGDGPMRADVESFIAENKLSETVLFLPFQENVMPLMKNAYLLVMTSRFEGFGLVLAEALYAGTPVVSLDCEYGPSEIIEDGKNGILLRDQSPAQEINRSIVELSGNTELYNEMKKNSRSSVECFVDNYVFEKYKELFC